MPKLIDNRKTIEIDITSIDGGKIFLYDSLTAADVEKLVIETESGKQQKILLPLTLLIKDWNLEDAEGNKLPITVENVGKLDFKDVNLIYQKLNLNSDFLKQGQPA